ncbi:MAG: phosphoribosyltransferase [Vicinamibacteraceae bacterium]
MRFHNRDEAGHLLAERLRKYGGQQDVVVLGLPRGGVPVAFAVAQELGLPLDVFLVRRLGHPSERELTIGAVTSGGVQLLDEPIVQSLCLPREVIDSQVRSTRAEVERRERKYRELRRPHELVDKSVILVHDGLPTGATMRVAAKGVRAQGARRVIVAVPVASMVACSDFQDDVDDTVCLQTPAFLGPLNSWYKGFERVTDEAVRTLLARAAEAGHQ